MIMLPQLSFNRRELKFHITPEIYASIVGMIGPYMKLDPNARDRKGNLYTIRSLYLDNDLWDSYYENLDGLKTRRKLRVRAYGLTNETLYMEIKKKFDYSVMKRRHLIHRDRLPLILEKGRDDEPTSFLSNFLFLVGRLRLKPQILIEYEREAYTGLESPTTRVTFDRDVRAASCRFAALYPEFIQWAEVFREGSIILELKFDDVMPRFMKEIVRELNLMHEPISKYCTGVRACKLV